MSDGDPVAEPATSDWASIRRWRDRQRTRLNTERRALSCRSQREAGNEIIAGIVDKGPSLAGERIGFYWPIQGEVDLRAFISGLLRTGAQAALPVIVDRNQSLEFWKWGPGQELCRSSIWNIPIPPKRDPVVPTVLLVPLLGFDEHCHRLGNGGGYYDRTLAALYPKPLTIGVGYEFARLRSIFPQSHDIAMDHVATEKSFITRC